MTLVDSQLVNSIVIVVRSHLIQSTPKSADDTQSIFLNIESPKHLFINLMHALIAIFDEMTEKIFSMLSKNTSSMWNGPCDELSSYLKKNMKPASNENIKNDLRNHLQIFVHTLDK